MKKTILTALILCTVFFIGASSCFADVIYGCVKNNGQLSIVTGPGQCKHNETPISWNAQEPGYVKQFSCESSINSQELIYCSVRCDGNDYVTGCSYDLLGYEGLISDYHFSRVLPDVCGVGDVCHGCRIGVYNSSNETLYLTFAAIAYCSNAP